MNLWAKNVFVSLVLGLGVANASQVAHQNLELYSLVRVNTAENSHSAGNELSGAAPFRGTRLFVTDDKTDGAIYQLRNRNLVKFIDLASSDLLGEYRQTTVEKSGRHWDLEGMAICPLDGRTQEIFLINERVRDVLKLTVKGANTLNGGRIVAFENISKGMHDYAAADVFPSSLDDVFVFTKEDMTGYDDKLFDFERDFSNRRFFGKKDGKKKYDNAGFEGIAADCVKRVLYVAKERQPRYIVKLSFQGDVLDAFPIPESAKQTYQAVRDPWSGEGNLVVEPDVSDLYFYEGLLYVLERNTTEITAMDPATMAVIARYDYGKYGHIYTEVIARTGLPTPFGMAETLIVREEKVSGKSRKVFELGFDNGAEHGINAKGASIFGCDVIRDQRACVSEGDLNPLYLTLTGPWERQNQEAKTQARFLIAGE